MAQAGGRLERLVHSGRNVWIVTIVVWLVGLLLTNAAVPPLIWEGLWTLFFLYMGSYCLRNFIQCRETHCAITGPGWTLIGLGAIVFIGHWMHLSLGWSVFWIAFLLVAFVGYGIQWLVKQRTGRDYLG